MKTEEKAPSDVSQDARLAALEERQEELAATLQDLKQQLDGREGAITGRLMELAQEIRELRGKQ